MSKIHLNGRQKFLGKLENRERKNIDPEIVRWLNWNMRDPSLRRATKQTDWLEKNTFDIFVFSEVKFPQGCIHIRDRFESLCYVRWFTL